MTPCDEASDHITCSRLGGATGSEGVRDDRADVLAGSEHEPAACAGLDQKLDQSDRRQQVVTADFAQPRSDDMVGVDPASGLEHVAQTGQ